METGATGGDGRGWEEVRWFWFGGILDGLLRDGCPLTSMNTGPLDFISCYLDGRF